MVEEGNRGKSETGVQEVGKEREGGSTGQTATQVSASSNLLELRLRLTTTYVCV